MTDAVRPGDLDATVAPNGAPEILAGLGAHRWVLSGPKRAHRFCTHEAAAASLAADGELTSDQHETAVALLAQWTGTVRALVEAAWALHP